jgi:hypothetical protein
MLSERNRPAGRLFKSCEYVINAENITISRINFVKNYSDFYVQEVGSCLGSGSNREYVPDPN